MFLAQSALRLYVGEGIMMKMLIAGLLVKHFCKSEYMQKGLKIGIKSEHFQKNIKNRDKIGAFAKNRIVIIREN